MEREKHLSITSLMRPALKEAYLAVTEVLNNNEYKAVKTLKFFSGGNVHSIRWSGLTREMEEKVEDAVWDVMIRREEKNLDKDSKSIGFSAHITKVGSVSNSCYLEIS